MPILRQIRWILIALAVGGSLLSAWRYGWLGRAGDWLPAPATTSGKTVRFDNGNAREPAVSTAHTQVQPRMRKCVRLIPGPRPQEEVTYTDRECPDGMHEAQITTEQRVSVVPSHHATARPPGAAPGTGQGASAAGGGRSTVRDLMLGSDTQQMQQLKDQQLERAVNR